MYLVFTGGKALPMSMQGTLLSLPSSQSVFASSGCGNLALRADSDLESVESPLGEYGNLVPLGDLMELPGEGRERTEENLEGARLLLAERLLNLPREADLESEPPESYLCSPPKPLVPSTSSSSKSIWARV